MVEKAIAWLSNLIGKIIYSMSSRNGPKSYDCSSSIYHALITAGIFPKTMSIGNTDSLFGDLERNGFVRVKENADDSITTKRGDVFIWGKRGASSGAAGHTGMFIDANNIVHCSSGYNGMHVDNHDWLWDLNGRPEVTVYRYVGAVAVAAVNPVDQTVEVGSFIKFSGTFVVNDLQYLAGLWQVRTNALCKAGFTWEDNGIPAAMLTEIDASGYATTDQELAVGSKYEIPGKYKVLDVGSADGMWLALIEYQGLKLWVDPVAATEVSSSDAGTPTPGKKPPAPQQPATPPAKPAETTPATPSEPAQATTPSQTEEPSQTNENTPQAPSNNVPAQNNKPKEDDIVAFPSAEQQEQLKINAQKSDEQFDKTDLAVVDKEGKTSKKAFVGALYMFVRSWALVVIPVVSAGVMVGHVDWKVVELTGAGAALIGLDKFLHDNPKVPFNGITGF